MDTDEHITQLGVDNSSANVMREGTTIISARGTVGRLGLTAIPMAMNQSCYGIQGAAGIGDYFVYFSLREMVADLQRRTHGSVFDTITRATFDTLERPKPDSLTLQAFEGVVGPLMEGMRRNLRENRTLTEIRNCLLPKLLSGQVRVAAVA